MEVKRELPLIVRNFTARLGRCTYEGEMLLHNPLSSSDFGIVKFCEQLELIRI